MNALYCILNTCGTVAYQKFFTIEDTIEMVLLLAHTDLLTDQAFQSRRARNFRKIVEIKPYQSYLSSNKAAALPALQAVKWCCQVKGIKTA